MCNFIENKNLKYKIKFNLFNIKSHKSNNQKISIEKYVLHQNVNYDKG